VFFFWLRYGGEGGDGMFFLAGSTAAEAGTASVLFLAGSTAAEAGTACIFLAGTAYFSFGDEHGGGGEDGIFFFWR